MGVFPRAAQSTSSVATLTVALDPNVVAGDIQYVMVSSARTNPHVWPAGWTVKAAGLGEVGYVSVAARTFVGGDTGPVISDGGFSTTWLATALCLKSTVAGATIAVSDEEATFAASSVNVPVAACSGAVAHPTLVVLTSGALTSQYPFLSGTIDTSVASAPPLLTLPYGAVSSPAFTLTRSGAVATVTFAVLANDANASPSVQPYSREELAEPGIGYAFVPFFQTASGGSVSVVVG